jgi:diketogulonate reductase-like aldo/keto reductase
VWLGLVAEVRLGTALYKNDCTAAVLQALQSGYHHLDAAEAYANEEVCRVHALIPPTSIYPSTPMVAFTDAKLIEQFTGKAIKDSGIPRDKLFITSKCGMGKAKPEDLDVGDSIRQALEKVSGHGEEEAVD